MKKLPLRLLLPRPRFRLIFSCIVLGVQIHPGFGETPDLRSPVLVEIPTELPPLYPLWSEMMKSIHPGYAAPKTAAEASIRDSDGDGWTDLEEAHFFTDPLERPLTPEEVQTQLAEIQRQVDLTAQAQEAAMAAARALLTPWHHDAMIGTDGQPFSLTTEIEARHENLRKRLPAMRTEAKRRKAEAEALARQSDWPLSYPHGNGHAVLVGVRNGIPEYHVPDNLAEAQTINVHKLWPGGSTGLALTGLPADPLLPRVQIGMWEPGNPAAGYDRPGTALLSHPEYSGRLVDAESGGTPSPPDKHATHVAGTLAATGLAGAPAAKGMAYEAKIMARDSIDDIGEIGFVLTDGIESNDFFVSNHSYGIPVGWDKLSYNGSSITVYEKSLGLIGLYNLSQGVHSGWLGDLSPDVIGGLSPFSDEVEDFKFGFYSDDSKLMDPTVREATYLLPVRTAGNDRNDSSSGEIHLVPGAPPGEITGWHLERQFPVNGTTYNLIWTNVIRQKDGGTTGYDSISQDRGTKNVLTVGSVKDLTEGLTPESITDASIFSNFGPMDDGRIKPDVVAAGENVFSSSVYLGGATYESLDGTSQASPAVTGGLGLMVQLFQRYRGSDFRPHAALLKGLAIHTAVDLASGMLSPGPDYRTGWGLFNAEGAAQHLNPTNASRHGHHARMVLVDNGVLLSIPVVAAGGQPLKVTICWTDPSGDPVQNSIDPPDIMLKNDLDLTVTTTLGGQAYEFFPWVFPAYNQANTSDLASKYNPQFPVNPLLGVERDFTVASQTYNKSGVMVARPPFRNFRDNVEQVYIPTPVSGATYTIKIRPRPAVTIPPGITYPAATLVGEGVSSPAQETALLISGAQPQPTPPFQISTILRTGVTQLTIGWYATIGTVYSIEASTDLTGWQTLPGQASILAQAEFISRPVTTSPSDPHRYYRIRKLL